MPCPLESWATAGSRAVTYTLVAMIERQSGIGVS